MTRELAQLVDRCLLVGFTGRSASDDLRALVAGGLGGVILFKRNIGTVDEVAALTAALRAERPDVLVAADEEGGVVTRLEVRSGSSYPGNLALGAIDDLSLTRAVAGSIGGALAGAGVNVDLAPVVDVNSNPRNPVIGVRSFGADPDRVAAHGAAFVQGLQERGIAACAKHFPGHGDTEVDSHVGLPVVERTLDDLRAVELVPFRAAIEAGVRAVMTAHVRFRALDEAPATVSRALVQGLLREELGFGGVVLTDALEMQAIAATVGVAEAAVRALEAGADLICLGRAHDREPVRGAIFDALAARRLAADRLAEAAERVERLAASTSSPAPAALLPEVGREAARRALRTAGSPTLDTPAVVAEIAADRNAGVGAVDASLLAELAAREPATSGRRLEAPASDVDSLLEQAAGRPLVLVADEPQRHPWQRAALERARAARPDAILVALGVPDPELDLGGKCVVAHSRARVSLAAVAELLLSR